MKIRSKWQLKRVGGGMGKWPQEGGERSEDTHILASGKTLGSRAGGKRWTYRSTPGIVGRKEACGTILTKKRKQTAGEYSTSVAGREKAEFSHRATLEGVKQSELRRGSRINQIGYQQGGPGRECRVLGARGEKEILIS